MARTSRGCARRRRSPWPQRAGGASTAPSTTPTLTLRQAAQRRGVGRRRRQRLGQRRHVPRPAHDRDASWPVGDRPAHDLAHVRLALAPRAASERPARRGPRPSPRPRTSNAGGPSPRCSMTSSHQRSGSGSPAAAASAASGSPRLAVGDRPTRRRRRRAGERRCSGRSIARTGTPCRCAHVNACHSGLNSANGRNAAALRPVEHVAEQGDRRDADPESPTQAQRRLAVGRQLDEHDVGSQRVERAQHRPRRPGPVVADRRAACTVGGHRAAHQSSSRQAS